MSITLSRRGLLTAAALGTAGAAFVPFAWAASEQPFFQRFKLPIGLELYTVAKELAEDLDGTLSRVSQIGYKDVEVSGLFGHTAAQLREACNRHGLVCRALHANAQVVRDPADPTFTDMPKLIDDAKALGVKYVVLPMPPLRLDFRSSNMSMEAFTTAVSNLTADDWKACAQMLNEKGEQLARAGLKIGYHNHNIEFKPLGDTTPYEFLMQATHPSVVTFELDVGWVASAGLDPIDILRRHSGRFRLMHVKDLKSSTKANYTVQTDPADVGAGKLNWASLLPAAYEAGIREFIVEQEPPYPAGPLVAIDNAYRFLSQLNA